MGLRIAIIGAGSRSFSPAVIRDILLSEALCSHGVELVLMDVLADHLPENEAYARRVMAKLQRPLAVSATTDLDTALAGADFVITAFEVDRYRYWSQDFHIPSQYGFKQVYGENGGPGGIFHALRNLRPILQVARAMERQCPKAVLLNFSNPEHKLCEAVSRLTTITAVGLCHGVGDGLRQIAGMLDLPASAIAFRACGINHFTFFQTIKHAETGEDLYPRLRAVDRAAPWMTHWHELALGRVLLRTFGLWPSPGSNHYGEYIHWASEFMASELNFYYDAMEGEPWVTGNIPPLVYTVDRAPTKQPWHPIAESSPPMAPVEETFKPSNEFAVPIITRMTFNQPGEVAAVNVQNRGAIPNLPDDLVVEVPALCDARGLHPVRMAPLPEAIAALIRTQASINKLIVEAYVEKSKNKLLQAILLDPTVDSYKNAVHMMNEMIGLQQDLLPELT